MRGGRKAGLKAEVLCEGIFPGSTADLPEGQTRGGDSQVAPGRTSKLKEAVRPPAAEALMRGGQSGENVDLFTSASIAQALKY